MMTHPGAKLWFMGCEIGQFAEWDEKKSVEWFLLDYPAHAALQHYFAALQNFYLEHPALRDEDPADPSASFAWLDVSNAAESIFVFRRISREGKEAGGGAELHAGAAPGAYGSGALRGAVARGVQFR